MKRAAHFFRVQPSCHRLIAGKLKITQETPIKPAIAELRHAQTHRWMQGSG